MFDFVDVMTKPAIVRLDGERFTISLDYTDKELIARIKGIQWNPAGKHWYCYQNDVTAAEILYLADGGRFEVSPTVRARCAELLGRADKNRNLSKSLASGFKLRPGFGSPDYYPKPFQLAGVEYAINIGNSCAFWDDMGVGKSIQMLATVWHRDAFPLVVVTKATLKFNIEDECRLAFGDSKVITVCKSDTVIPPSDIIIINYDILSSGWLDKHKKEVVLSPVAQRIMDHGFKSFAIDESHQIKTSNKQTESQRFHAVFQMSEDAIYRYDMSGTPAPNMPLEYINHLKYLRVLDKLGGEWHFKMRYCDAKQKFVSRAQGRVWDFSGSSNGTELNDRFKSICMVRRTKQEALPELGEKQRTHIRVEIPNMAEYNRIKKDVIKFYSGIKAEEESFLKTIHHLRGIERELAIEAYRKKVEVKAKFNEACLKYGILRQVVSQGKIPATVDHVTDLLQAGRKVILFAFYRATQLALFEALKHFNPVTVFGGDSEENRKQSVRAFQNNPDVNLIIVSIGAGSDGLNLTAAQDVVMHETGYVPTVMAQCEDRAFRFGQLGQVHAKYFWGEGTIDANVRAILADKSRIFGESMNGERGNHTAFDARELLDKLTKE